MKRGEEKGWSSSPQRAEKETGFCTVANVPLDLLQTCVWAESPKQTKFSCVTQVTG